MYQEDNERKKERKKIPQVFPVLSATVGGKRIFTSSRIPYQKSHETEYVEKKTDQEIIKRVMVRKKPDQPH